jgi:hypothetical protein
VAVLNTAAIKATGLDRPGARMGPSTFCLNAIEPPSLDEL